MTKPLLAIESTGKILSVALSRVGGEEHKGDGRLCENTSFVIASKAKQSTDADISMDCRVATLPAMTGEVCFTQSDGSFGVASGGIVERRSGGALSHLTDLVPTIKELLEAEGVTLASLGALAVSVGPGSFTGIRIGVSAARAIAQVAGLPVIAVPTLETFVCGFAPGDIVCPLLDARRGQFYCGAYRLTPGGAGRETLVSGGARRETLVPGAARDPEEFAAALEAALPDGTQGDGTQGDGSFVSLNDTKEPSPCVPCVLRYVRDEDEAQSAVKVLKWARAFGRPVAYTELEPLYMRKAEAQRRLDEKLAAEGGA